MTKKEKDEKEISVEKRRALKYLAGATGLVMGSALSKKWVTPSLQAAILPDQTLSGLQDKDID